MAEPRAVNAIDPARGSTRPPAVAVRRRWVIASLAVVLVAAAIVSALVGQLPISATDVLGSLARAVGIHTTWAPTDAVTEATLWSIRLPRVMMAVAVGGALAVSGAVMQAIFGNPLAEPGVVGISAGSAFAASIGIVFGATALGIWTTPVLAFIGGVVATLFVYWFAREGGKTEVVTLLLTGIAVNAFASAGLAFMTFLGSTTSREQIVFWQLGSLNGSTWSQVGIVVVCLLVALAIALGLARQFDVLSLGERSARHLGVDVERLRIIGILIVALATGAAVAFCGIIAFVGLIVPHAVRMGIGPAHRSLLIASVLGGGSVVLVADIGARALVANADLPIGMLTALVGGPFFFWLLRRTRRQAGGWA